MSERKKRRYWFRKLKTLFFSNVQRKKYKLKAREYHKKFSAKPWEYKNGKYGSVKDDRTGYGRHRKRAIAKLENEAVRRSRKNYEKHMRDPKSMTTVLFKGDSSITDSQAVTCQFKVRKKRDSNEIG